MLAKMLVPAGHDECFDEFVRSFCVFGDARYGADGAERTERRTVVMAGRRQLVRLGIVELLQVLHNVASVLGERAFTDVPIREAHESSERAALKPACPGHVDTASLVRC